MEQLRGRLVSMEVKCVTDWPIQLSISLLQIDASLFGLREAQEFFFAVHYYSNHQIRALMDQMRETLVKLRTLEAQQQLQQQQQQQRLHPHQATSEGEDSEASSSMPRLPPPPPGSATAPPPPGAKLNLSLVPESSTGSLSADSPKKNISRSNSEKPEKSPRERRVTRTRSTSNRTLSLATSSVEDSDGSSNPAEVKEKEKEKEKEKTEKRRALKRRASLGAASKKIDSHREKTNPEADKGGHKRRMSWGETPPFSVEGGNAGAGEAKKSPKNEVESLKELVATDDLTGKLAQFTRVPSIKKHNKDKDKDEKEKEGGSSSRGPPTRSKTQRSYSVAPDKR